MKLRVKIPVIYILSIILSAVIFVVAVWALMTFGWWSGITQADMDRAVSGTADSIASFQTVSGPDISRVFGNWKNKYPGMELELLSEKQGVLYATSPSYSIADAGELVNALSRNGQLPKEKWVAARSIELNNETAYIVAVVPADYYVGASFTLNGNKGYGIFGKMFVIGIVITIAVSCAFAFVFTRKIIKRFESLYKSIESFDMENMEINILDETKDELGQLTSTYKSMAERLKKQIEKEKVYEEERKRLVSNISHDLRTPLTSIVGYSESLDNKVFENEEEQKKYISIIHKKAVYMDRLLSELTEFSKIESGVIESNKEKLDIAELAREILIEYLPIVEAEGIELNVEIHEDTGKINIDKNMMSRAIRNVIDNAVKYGKSGGRIDFFLYLYPEKSVCIEIKDYGQGIDEKDMPHVFERFYRAGKGRTSKEGGMGLGLAIADEIVKLHGGIIKAERSKEKGITFKLILPR